LVAVTAYAGRLQIIRDDFLTTSAARVRHAADIGACNAVLRQRYHEGQEITPERSD
jgi:enolase